jgi:hypothetical protein
MRMRNPKAVIKPLRVEVVSKMLGVQTEECKNCRLVFEEVGLKSKFHNQEINQYPDDIKEEVLRLSDWIRDLVQRYPNNVQFKIIDAMTPLGFYKMLRHRIRKFPSFIINAQQTYSGWDTKVLEPLINQHLQLRNT